MRFVHYYKRAMVGDGGPTRAVWGWAGALSDAGHEVVILHDGGASSSPLAHPGVEAREIAHEGKCWMHRRASIFGHIRDGDILILHSGYVGSNLVAANGATRRDIPYLVVPHGAYEPSIRRRRRLLRRVWEVFEREMLANALAVHVFFDTEVENVREFAKYSRCIVAPIGMDIPPESWCGGGGYFAWLGRYDIEHKGLDILFQALALLGEMERPRIVLHGRDHKQTRAQVEDLARVYGLSSTIDVLGPISGSEKIEFLRRADGYVHPSRWESFGIALLENVALGVPCLVSNVAHAAGPLQAAGAAIAVRPTPEEFARGLRALAGVGSEMSHSARDFVAERLSWSVIARSYVEQIESIRGPRSAVGPNDA